MTPGTTSWLEAAPVVLAATLLLFVPGVVTARLLRVPWGASVGVAPALSTSVLVAGGVVAARAGIAWGALPVVVTVAVTWLLAAVVGYAVVRAGRSRATPVRDGDSSVDVQSRPAAPWLMVLAWVGGLAFALASVVLVITAVAGTPDHFPQHPDTIFHLAEARWMSDNRDVSVLHSYRVMEAGRTNVYPADFHVVTATTSLLTGANVVVATQSAVLAMSALVWPAGVIVLACALFGRRAEVVAASAVASVLFTAFPYTVMGFGVLWPNLFGQSLLPGVLAAALAAGARLVPHRAPAMRPWAGVVVTLVTVPGLTLAHPNALVTFLVLVAFIVATRVLRFAWDERRRPLRGLGAIGALVVLAALAAYATVVVRPAGMFATGAPGPEKALRGAVLDTVYFGPRHAPQLQLLTVVVVIGALSLLWRHRACAWIPLSCLAFGALYLLNVAVDERWTRDFTWPWYNNAIRLAVAGSLPAVLTATAGFVAVGALLARLVRRAGPWPRVVATGLVLLVFLVVTRAYVYPHRAFLQPYYHPNTAHSWASDQELRSLRELSGHIPDGAVTAANAWNGGTYLYVVSGKPVMPPTEKALFAGDRKLLAAKLNQAGTSPEVCAAARRQRVEYAIVGGQPFAWAGAKRVALYAGIDKVPSSSAFRLVAEAPPYRLYQLTSCAGG
ncbi:DUF6541 family protein [Knoellia koreensis]|uniref:Uncharacterized protein n=1 Tax=Knoellia koreensis TaxID=2730921 RepID=A0A849HJ97_9MICO|nr:DUF6541 family protein [Knoellia sp. DB2414S]NNM46401.1 hypothetical protein [Knoellia sp. DB2414S]